MRERKIIVFERFKLHLSSYNLSDHVHEDHELGKHANVRENHPPHTQDVTLLLRGDFCTPFLARQHS